MHAFLQLLCVYMSCPLDHTQHPIPDLSCSFYHIIQSNGITHCVLMTETDRLMSNQRQRMPVIFNQWSRLAKFGISHEEQI